MDARAVGGGPGLSTHGESSEQDEMKIFLKVTKTVAMKVKKSETVGVIKERFSEREGIPSKLQKIFYGGSPLEDEKTLVEHGISNESTLNLFISTEASININVKLPPNGKMIKFEFTKWNTVKDIKAKIHAVEGILAEHQHILYKGVVLDDDQLLLGSCNIQHNSTLNVVTSARTETHISVCIPDRETIYLDVKSWYTIWDVKSIIESIVQISAYKHKLSYAGVLLDDSQSLSAYNVVNGSILHLIYSSIQIFLRTVSGNTVTLEVESSDTVEQLKNNIYQKTRVPTPYQSLIYAGKCLTEEERTLAHYDVRDKSTLHLVLVPRGRCQPYRFQIYLHMKNRKEVTLDVESSDTVDQLKEEINHKTGISIESQILKYAGMVLSNGCRNLTGYNLQDKSILHLEIKPWRLSVYIYPCKEFIFLELQDGNTIQDVKVEIEKKNNISLKNQMLFYGGKLLWDSMPLSSDYLPRESELTLDFEW